MLARRTLFKEAREFVAEWRELRAANQPMPDPPGLPPQYGLRDFLRLSLRDHWDVVRETLYLYKLSLFDREEAIRLLKIDAEIRRQREEERLKRESAAGTDPSQPQATAETDMAELTERVRKMFPKELASVKSVDDAVHLAAAKKEDIQGLASDRLELVGEAIHAFMEGYREGKDKARLDVEKSADPMLERFMEPIMSAADKHKQQHPPSPPRPPPPPSDPKTPL